MELLINTIGNLISSMVIDVTVYFEAKITAYVKLSIIKMDELIVRKHQVDGTIYFAILSSE